MPLYTIDLFRELYAHMEWADALIWKTAFATQTAPKNKVLHDRLFHVHQAQRVFYQVWTRQEPELRKADELSSLEDLY
jgi:hypothetical protein